MQYNDYRALGVTLLSNGLLAYYPQLKIDDAEMMVILQLEMFAQKGDFFPTNEEIAANTNFSVAEIGSLLQKLIEQNFLVIDQVTDQKGMIGNKYNLNQLYDKLDKLLAGKTDSTLNKNGKDNSTSVIDNSPLNQLVRQFEIEFGRYLSPIEREEIAAWLNVDHYDPAIIRLALREAVLSQAYSLKYIDRILLNWQRHNLKTVSEVQKFLRRNR
ncbi:MULTISPECIES: DnaD domain protein [Lactobacillus]|uniref:DNA replication protein DnaD n=1 Tax=Lactobacillus melliventris TaxID=1218507 RepID=A0A0F4LG94_9LACO|nr:MULTISPECIES: DnaD domain protein [Lactobacillus]MCT6891597.1 DnaD domain protein [Lactobacillus sp.]KJY56571.1 DNA replication protein DnaD [Lactobacillus melliventris]MBC6349875.1 DnaD domain protein [Lactobacillus melliventris]MBH9989218.1 DnaD domain protein [Lactobacillus sp. M0392]MBI0023829.1 DnaD domain protein [Lactobacillus sp. W8171]